jgi:phenylpyruvate tautomerase PptA (4-oxalocrotonate tautomerase family)
MVIDNERDERRCVTCGFIEARPIAGVPEALATRVTRASARRVDAAPEAIRILGEIKK